MYIFRALRALKSAADRARTNKQNNTSFDYYIDDIAREQIFTTYNNVCIAFKITIQTTASSARFSNRVFFFSPHFSQYMFYVQFFNHIVRQSRRIA